MLPEPDPYQVLQVDPAADPAVIQAAYRALARRFHPDGLQPDAHRMALLNRAYAILRDPANRRRHDAERNERPRRVAVPVNGGAAVDFDSRRRVAAAAAGGAVPGILDFGRYAGWRLTDLVRHDPDYLRWLSRHSSGIRFREQIAALLPREPDLVRRANSVA